MGHGHQERRIVGYAFKLVKLKYTIRLFRFSVILFFIKHIFIVNYLNFSKNQKDDLQKLGKSWSTFNKICLGGYGWFNHLTSKKQTIRIPII